MNNILPGFCILLGLCVSASANTTALAEAINWDKTVKSSVQTSQNKQHSVDLVQNGKFADGRKTWILHECKFQNDHVVFANTDNVFSQLSQKRKISLKAGTTVRLEVEASVEDPDGLLKAGKDLAQYRVFFRDEFGKKILFAPGENGKAGRFTATNGKRQTFTVNFKVPEGTGMIQPAIVLNIPVTVKIYAMRLFCPMTTAEIEKNGIDLSAGTAPKKQNSVDLVQNGKFAEGRKTWILHECKFQKDHVVFANTDNVFSQLSQKRKIAIKAGTTVRLEVEASVEDPNGLLKAGKDLAQYRVFFRDEFGQKILFAPGENGKAGRFTATNGKRQTFTVDFKVPEGTGMVQPAIVLNIPVTLKIYAMRLFCPANAAGIEKSESPVPVNTAKLPSKKGMPTPDGVSLCQIAYPVTIPLNGTMKAWQDVPVSGYCRIPLPAFSAPEEGEKDASGFFKLAMDKENFYVLAVIKDDKLQFKEGGDFNNDSVELFFSPLFRRAERNAPTDFHITVAPENSELNSFSVTGSNYRNSFRPQVKGIKVSGGWAFELAFPLKNPLFEIFPYDGYVLGFNMEYNDNDSGKRDHKISWVPDLEERSWQRPDVLGGALLRTGGSEPVRPARATPAEKSPMEKPLTFVNRHPGTLNIFRNGDFEKGEMGWTDWYCVDGSFMKIISDKSANGKKCAVIDARLLEKNALASALNSHCFKVIPGERYRLTFRAKNETALPVRFPVSIKSQNYHITYIPMGCKLAPNEGWKTFSGEIVIPSQYSDVDSVVQIMLRGRSGGTRVLFDDFKLVRFTPGKTDALLEFDATGYAFTPQNVKPARLLIHNSGDTAREYELEVSFHDFVRNNRKLKSLPPQRIKLAPGAKKIVSIPVWKEKYGLFQLRTRLIDRQDNSEVLRRTEYAIYHPFTARAAYAGACLGHHHLRPSVAALMDGCTAVGISSLRSFIDRQQEYAPGKFDFRTLDIMLEEAEKRNIDIIACLSTMGRTSGKATDDIEEYGVYLRAFVEHYKGRMPYYEIGNEPNLWMGWPPKSSAEEYAMFLRAAYCTIRSIDPQAKIMNAGISQGSLDDFTRKLLKLNAGNFYDIYAFHPYDLGATANYRLGFEETIRTVKSYRGDTEIFDTESNTQSSSAMPCAEKLSKRIPVYRYLGIARHHNWAFDRMSSGHIYSYYDSPGSAYPVFAWMTHFYPDNCRSVGALDGKGDFECYVVKLPSGEYRSAVWRTYPGSRAVFRMPATAQTRVYDVFGNEVTAKQKRSGNVIELNPEPLLPLFVKNCGDPATLKLKTFTIRNQNKNYRKVCLDTLLLPRKLNGFFDRHIPGSSTQKLDFYVKNYSTGKRHIRLTANSTPAGLKGTFEPAEMELAPGEIRFCTLTVTAPEKGKYVLHCGGKAGDEKLADVPVNFTVTGPFEATINGHHLDIANRSTGNMECSFSLSGRSLDVRPFQKNNLNIPAGSQSRIALTPYPRWRGNKLPVDGRFPVELQLTANKQQFLLNTFFEVTEAQKSSPGAKGTPWYPAWGETPFIILKNPAQTETAEAKLRFRWHNGTLHVAGQVIDPSFAPEGKGGYVSSGDSVIIGIDPDYSASASGYGGRVFEAGFAPAADNSPQHYRWDGRFGLEAAKPFPEAFVEFFRTAKGYDFNISIPCPSLKAGLQRIGLGVLVVNKTASGKREYLRFGSGMEKDKDASRFGTLLLD